MTDHSACLGDYQSLDPEQKDLLIEALHEAHHENMETIESLGNAVVSLGYGMHQLAKQTRKAQKKGGKKRLEVALIRVEAQLEALYRVALATVGMTPETVKQAEKFADIVGQLEADPTFNQDSPHEEGE